MFHPTTGTAQEPGQGASGYYVADEVWIQNQQVTFNGKVITSHIDIATGKKIADDVVTEATKITNNDTYKTSALEGKNVITPANATGNYSAGVVNVVYLYEAGETPTDPTEPTIPTEQPTHPVTTMVKVGDTNHDGVISIIDAIIIQKMIISDDTPTVIEKAIIL